MVPKIPNGKMPLLCAVLAHPVSFRGRGWLALCRISVAVPGRPSGVMVNASTPNTVRLHVLPPSEHNGLVILGYRVKYEDVVRDFDAGSLLLTCHI